MSGSGAAGNDAVTPREEAQISQIAKALGFAHDEFVRIRLARSGKRTIVQRGED